VPSVAIANAPSAPTLPSAPWLEPALSAPDDLLPHDHVPTFGSSFLPVVAEHDSALVETSFGAFVLRAKSGIHGPYSLGPRVFVAFGADGAAYVVRPSGRLLRATLSDDGGLGPFEPGGLVDGVTQWRVGRQVVAAANAEALHLSRDRGATFERATLAADSIAGVFVRSDDLLVVQASATFVSRDGGRSFDKTVSPPPLRQHGDWIYGEDRSCGKAIFVALSGAGRFVEVPSLPGDVPEQGRRWENAARRFAVSSELVLEPVRPMPWPDPRPFPNASKLYAGYPRCQVSSLGSGRITKTVKMIETGHDICPFECEGLGCLHGLRAPPLPPTKTRAYLFHDGLCPAATADVCAKDAPMLTPPHALFVEDTAFHAKSARSVPVPLGCRPRFTAFSAGLVVLPCASTKTTSTLWVATADADFRLEAMLPSSGTLGPDDFEMVSDGTAMLATYGKLVTDSRAWVRRPWAVGVKDAWRDVSRPNAIAFLLRLAGVVDVVVAEPDLGPDAISILEDRPDGVTTAVAHAKIPGDLWCIGRKDGVLVGIRRTAAGYFRRIVFHASGALDEGPLLDGRGRLAPGCGL